MQSKHQQRVNQAIRHVRPDQTPKGDLAMDGRLLEKLAAAGGVAAGADVLTKKLAALRCLDADIAHVHEYPVTALGNDSAGRPLIRGAFGEEFSVSEYGHTLVKPVFAEPEEAFEYRAPDLEMATAREVDFFRRESDLFLSAQIGGPVSMLDWTLGTENMMVWCLTDEEAVASYVGKMMDFEVGRACRYLDHGVELIIIADDIAFNSGALLPPATMESLVWPRYRDMIRRIKAHRDVPVFMHTDGDIRLLLDSIAACGFNGLHSLQPSAGMDIAGVKRKYGRQLCLWGNMDLDRLMTFGTPAEITEQVRWLCRNIGFDGGYILGTCNTLIDAIPLENALAMYRGVE